MNISNSLIKAFEEYKNGTLCGEYFRALYVDKDFERKPSQAMMIGHRFEYLVTGALLRDGSVPPDIKTKSGSTVAAMQYVERFVDIAKKELHPLGEGGVVSEYKIDGVNFKGIYDWFAEGEIIQDIKTSGMVNKFGNFGWKDISGGSQLGQARFYTWLEWKKTGAVLPFEFHVYGTTKTPECKIIPVSVNVDSLKRFEDYLLSTAEEIFTLAKMGFEPSPSYSKCQFCPWKGKCKFMNLKVDRDEVVVA